MSSCPLQACDGGDDTAAAFAALCEPQHLRGQLALARRPASAEATAARQSVSLQAAQQTFTAGLQAAAAFMAQAVQPATAAARERHAAELQRWLAARHCSLTTCSPEALLAYVTMHWLPKHTGSELSTGERVAAPSSLANMLSHLSSHFEHIEGRNGAHQLLNGVQHGNPVRSSCIAELRQGYCNAMRNKGVCQGAAVPVSFEQASQLLAALATALRESEPGTLLAALLARDGFLVSLLWHTALRGDNAARLRDVDFITPDGEPACSQLWSASRSGGELEPDRLYFFRPDGTKSQRAANIGRVPIKVLVECEQQLCCAWWLQQCGLEYAAFAMKPLQGFLTRPLQRNRRAFADKPMSSSSINQMLKARQQQFNIAGELTPHGFRRGRLQQMASIGVSVADITQHALNKTESIIQQRYLNLDAHRNNLKRARH